MDPDKALRNPRAVSLDSDVFVLSLALAGHSQRLTGISFFGPNGKLGSTGRRLETFLNSFGRTLYPPAPILLASGDTVPRRDRRFLTVYSSDVAQCFPGKTELGIDRPPTTTEMQRCIGQGFLADELSIVQPSVLLLMGRRACQAFHRFVLHVEPSEAPLEAQIEAIVRSSKLPSAMVYGRAIFVAPICHASGANPSFTKMLKNARFASLIESALNT